MFPSIRIALAVAMTLAASSLAQAADPARLPVLVPLSGFLALEGTSQRNGAELAIKTSGLATAEIVDTGTTPEAAVNALERAVDRGPVPAVAASMLGVQMLAMIPLADQYRVPLVTVSGTAKLTEMGSRYVFRFFPGDAVTKRAQVRYALEEGRFRRPALLYQTTAYGQSGRAEIARLTDAAGAPLVMSEGLDVQLKDLSAAIAKIRAAKPDVVLLHLHAGPTALFVRQAAAQGLDLPVIAGSALHQPATTALLEPAELKGMCAETNASPVSAATPEMAAFLDAYRKAYGGDPDGYAVGQYDGMTMALQAMQAGAKTAEDVTKALATGTHKGLAMTYKSDGVGNMAHSAVIVCFDGTSRAPRIAKRYDDLVSAVN